MHTSNTRDIGECIRPTRATHGGNTHVQRTRNRGSANVKRTRNRGNAMCTYSPAHASAPDAATQSRQLCSTAWLDSAAVTDPDHTPSWHHQKKPGVATSAAARARAAPPPPRPARPPPPAAASGAGSRSTVSSCSAHARRIRICIGPHMGMHIDMRARVFGYAYDRIWECISTCARGA